MLHHESVEFLIVHQRSGQMALAIGFGGRVVRKRMHVAVMAKNSDGVGIDDHFDPRIRVQQNAVGGLRAHAPHRQQFVAGWRATVEGAVELTEGT